MRKRLIFQGEVKVLLPVNFRYWLIIWLISPHSTWSRNRACAGQQSLYLDMEDEDENSYMLPNKSDEALQDLPQK